MNDDHTGQGITETTEQARQGVTGHKVRYVLFFSTLGAMIFLSAVLVAFIS